MHPFAPNFATFLGPMTGLGHSSIIFMIECQMQLLINILREMWSRKATKVQVKSSVRGRQRRRKTRISFLTKNTTKIENFENQKKLYKMFFSVLTPTISN